MIKWIVIAFIGTTLVAGAIWANAPLSPLPADSKADLLVVEKGSHRLRAHSKGIVLREYPVALGRGSAGSKERQGDGRTPEGRYVIDRHNPTSSFHLALHVSYPPAVDAARGRAGGYDPGGDIMVHGMRNGLGWIGRAHQLVDRTNGCIALTDPEIEELYRIVPDGTAIEIRQ